MQQLTNQRVNEIVKRMCDRTIVVFGDVMLDEFVWGEVTRISPEAPVPVVDIRRESVHLGGAANVLANLVSLGARAGVVGVVGKDRAGERVCGELREAGALRAAESLIVDEGRPTTIKTRIIAHNQLVVRATVSVASGRWRAEARSSRLKTALRRANASSFGLRQRRGDAARPARFCRSPLMRRAVLVDPRCATSIVRPRAFTQNHPKRCG